MRIKVKRTTDSAVLPTYGSENAAGCDLYSAHDKVIYPHTTEKIDTGCQFELPDGYFAAIFATVGSPSTAPHPSGDHASTTMPCSMLQRVSSG